MLYAPSNLQRLLIERKKVVLSGDSGRVELAVYGPSMLSIFYSLEGQVIPRATRDLYPLLFSERYRDALSARREWESIQETETEYELRYGALSVAVDKASATVSVYRDGVLIHGGAVGDKDTVLPSSPLRVQQGSSGSGGKGKFNFRLEPDHAFFGLGEKSGGLDKRGRSFRMFNKDSLGYDAALSDPLYKAVPFFLAERKERGSFVGLYFPNFGIDEVNFGVESNYYYHVGLNGGPYGYFLLTGPGYREVLEDYADLVGAPALPPLFSFGYLGSSMGYTDPDDAERRVMDFFEETERRRIPCEGMYFSSGYAKADSGERYTFVWNRRKFPDPALFLGKLRKRGYRICCNVKPGILATHPWYADLARRGVFIAGASGEPCTAYYWGNDASFVDFSSEAGYRWWVESLTENIIDQGAAGVWNDNNEFELEDESVPAASYRTALPLLMAQASYEALRAARPGKRPWLISRSGYAGLQRYARTWTGDNVSDFRTLRYNILMGMNLALSGMPIYGHDLGGFFGPKPGAELLVRWCQSAVFQPRFVMHSWKSDGSATEPWTYPEAEEALEGLIALRYRFLPYVYNLAIQASLTGRPMEAPVALEFPADRALDVDSGDRLAGDAILVPASPAEGERSATVRLPAGTAWYDPERELALEGGKSATLDYPLRGARYLIRCGSVVPVNEEATKLETAYVPALTFLLFPPVDGPDRLGVGGRAAPAVPASAGPEDGAALGAASGVAKDSDAAEAAGREATLAGAKAPDAAGGGSGKAPGADPEEADATAAYPRVIYRYREDDGESDYQEGSHASYKLELARTGSGTYAFTLEVEEAPLAPPRTERRFIFRLPRGFSIVDGQASGGRAKAASRGSADTEGAATLSPGPDGTLGLSFTGIPRTTRFAIQGSYKWA